MKTIRDLFIKQKSYIVTYEIDDNYYLWIECLSENGCTLTTREFNPNMLENNLLVELHKSDESDETLCEWYGLCKFNLDDELQKISEIMQYAIETYESEQE